MYIISLPSPPGQDQEPWICSNSIDISCFDLEAEENEVAIIAVQFFPSSRFLFSVDVAASRLKNIDRIWNKDNNGNRTKWEGVFKDISIYFS